MILQLLTIHAMQRYLERVERLDLSAVRRKMAALHEIKPKSIKPIELVEYALAETGRTLECLERELVTEGLRIACEHGLPRFKMGNGVELVIRDNRVVTVLTRPRRPAKILSKRECEQGFQRSQRRARRSGMRK